MRASQSINFGDLVVEVAARCILLKHTVKLNGPNTTYYLYIHVHVFFFPIPFILLALLLSLPLSRDSDPGSYGRLFPLLTTVRALHFYREKIAALSSLVDSRRTAPTHARCSQQLIFLYFCKRVQNLTVGFELQDEH